MYLVVSVGMLLRRAEHEARHQHVIANSSWNRFMVRMSGKNTSVLLGIGRSTALATSLPSAE